MREAGASEASAISAAEAIEKGRQATKDDVHKLELTLKAEMHKSESSLKAEMQRMRTQLIIIKWMLGLVIVAAVVPLIRAILGI